jgi:metal-sulfur cluster biosynthetic enzyme
VRQTGDALTDAIATAVNTIADPCSAAQALPLGLVDMGLLDDVIIGPDGDVVVMLRLTSPTCLQIGWFATEITRRVLALDGVRSVEVRTDQGFDWTPSMMSDDARRRRRAALAAKGLRPLL